jgi:hypothetical protein
MMRAFYDAKGEGRVIAGAHGAIQTPGWPRTPPSASSVEGLPVHDVILAVPRNVDTFDDARLGDRAAV